MNRVQTFKRADTEPSIYVCCTVGNVVAFRRLRRLLYLYKRSDVGNENPNSKSLTAFHCCNKRTTLFQVFFFARALA